MSFFTVKIQDDQFVWLKSAFAQLMAELQAWRSEVMRLNESGAKIGDLCSRIRIRVEPPGVSAPPSYDPSSSRRVP